MKFPCQLSILFALVAATLAHGPALSPAALAQRQSAHQHARRAFSQCHGSLARRAPSDGEQRRAAFVQRHRLVARQAPTATQAPLATGANADSPFSGIPTCVLAPASELGPYCTAPASSRARAPPR